MGWGEEVGDPPGGQALQPAVDVARVESEEHLERLAHQQGANLVGDDLSRGTGIDRDEFDTAPTDTTPIVDLLGRQHRRGQGGGPGQPEHPRRRDGESDP